MPGAIFAVNHNPPCALEGERTLSITRPSVSCTAVVSFGEIVSSVSGTAISPAFHVAP